MADDDGRRSAPGGRGGPAAGPRRVVVVGDRALRDGLRAEIAAAGWLVVGESDTLPDGSAMAAAEDADLLLAGAAALAPSSGLSVREREVLSLLCQGLRTAQVADRLYVSPVTVRSHVATIVRKLGVRDRAEALARAAEMGLAVDLREAEAGGAPVEPDASPAAGDGVAAQAGGSSGGP